MGLTLRMAALFLLCAFLGSCTTMMAYEEQRLAKRGAKENPAPNASPVTGTILQPKIPVPKIDEAAIKADQSVQTAVQQLSENDPTKTSTVAPGPVIPFLKTKLTAKADLESVAKSYAAYAQAVFDVRISVEAFGINANVEGLRRVREAGEYWSLYLPQLRIRPDIVSITKADVQNLYGVFTVSGQQLQAALGFINNYIDSQKTKKSSVSNTSS
jgi:hypothetical protein